MPHIDEEPAAGALSKRLDFFADPPGLNLTTPECSSSASHAKARAEAAEARAAHPQVAAVEMDKQSVEDDVEDEDYYSDWAPGRVAATPERPVFSPTPESSVGARKNRRAAECAAPSEFASGSTRRLRGTGEMHQ